MGILARFSGRNKERAMDSTNGQALPKKTQWYVFGEDDANDGMLCIPEMYTNKLQQKIDYCMGFDSVKPGAVAAQYFIGQQPAMESAVMA